MTELLPETKAFLRDWLEWVDRGAPEGQPYLRGWGLCLNLFNCTKIIKEDHWRINKNLSELFEYKSVPFGANNYLKRAEEKTQHLDPARLEWVCNALEEI